jgi:S-formylglutathione hydrolase FrmB
MPDGRSSYGGTYFVNSSVTGNWEDFIVKDLVAYIDKTYRTIPRAESRAIAGQSMGGYSAIYIGMKNPEVFSTVYGMSACCLDLVADITADNPEWVPTLKLKTREDLVQSHLETGSKGNYQNALTALAAALSPNPDNPPLYVDFPFKLVDGEVQLADTTCQKWMEHFPVHMVEKYRENLLKLKGLRFIAGDADHLAHIPLGSWNFSQALTRAGIPHVFELDNADHREHVRAWLETKVLPFFSLMLTHGNPAWYKP